MTGMQRYFVTVGLTILCPFVGNTGPMFAILVVYCVLTPVVVISYRTWKMLRYNYFPTPMQIARGLKSTWPRVNQGPVVTRVKRLP